MYCSPFCFSFSLSPGLFCVYQRFIRLFFLFGTCVMIVLCIYLFVYIFRPVAFCFIFLFLNLFV